MFATAVGIDRAVKGDVWRRVAGDDRPRLFNLHLSLERRELLERVPAVVKDLAADRLEAARRVDPRRAPAVAVWMNTDFAPFDHCIRQFGTSLSESGNVSANDLFD